MQTPQTFLLQRWVGGAALTALGKRYIFCDMGVGMRYDERQQSWQVHWRCNGSGMHSMQVRVNAVGGDKAAAERVARSFQEYIKCTSDRSNSKLHLMVLNALIAAEFALRRTRKCDKALAVTAAVISDTTDNTSAVVMPTSSTVVSSSAVSVSVQASPQTVCDRLVPAALPCRNVDATADAADNSNALKLSTLLTELRHRSNQWATR